jgi:uncharacterized protein (TIGR02466 family)
VANNQSASAALKQAMQLHERGDLVGAQQYYQTALQAEPENTRALRLLGILKRDTGAIEASLELLGRAAELESDSNAALNELAMSQLVAGRFREATDSLHQAIRKNPSDATARTNLGALLQHRGHVKAAIDMYNEVLNDDPNDVEVRCNLAKALADAGDFDAALRATDLAIESADGHPFALGAKGAVLTDMRRYRDAIPLLKDANDHAPDDTLLVNLALCLDELGDTPAAIRILDAALDINPNNARALADLANCLTKQEQPAHAAELCEHFLQENPGETLVLGSYALALSAAGATEQAARLTDCKQLIQSFTLQDFLGNQAVAATNRAVSEQLLNDPSLLRNPVSKSTSGGAQTGELDLDSSTELTTLDHFFSASIEQAKAVYAQCELPAAPSRWQLRSWGTVLEAGGQQTAHMHPLGWLSAVYYVGIPDWSDEADPRAGHLLFGPAPERFRQVNPNIWYHAPQAGELIVFPSWFWHQTVPFTGAGQRVSLAFDAVPSGTLRNL